MKKLADIKFLKYYPAQREFKYINLYQIVSHAVKKKKFLSTLLKLILSIVLVYIVLTKLDFQKLEKLLKQIDYKYIILAYICVIIAQIYGGLRMKYYFDVIGMKFKRLYAISFYFIGTLFNIVLPGGIGGDGYKAYYFQKKFRVPWQQTVLGVIRGRASGLFFLVVFLLVFCYFYHGHIDIKYLDIILMTGIIAVFPCYSFLAKILLKESIKIQVGAMKYSLIVQLFYLFAIFFILESFGQVSNILGYIVVFLIANIVAIIPISIGGLGLRELTYITFAGLMHLDKDVGVTASFLFYISYSSVALFGFIPYLFIDKLDKIQMEYFDYRHATHPERVPSKEENKTDGDTNTNS